MSGSINFFRGHPTNRLLPSAEVLKASTILLSSERPGDTLEEDRHPLTYGSDLGSKWVRSTIADWSGRVFGLDKGSITP